MNFEEGKNHIEQIKSKRTFRRQLMTNREFTINSDQMASLKIRVFFSNLDCYQSNFQLTPYTINIQCYVTGLFF